MYQIVKIFLDIINLIIKFYNRFKKLNIKTNLVNYINLQKFVSTDIDYSYGHCRVNIQVSNFSTVNKLLSINDLSYRVSNFEKYNYSHFMFDYFIYEDINDERNNCGEILANKFSLFAFNNGSEDEAKSNIFIEMYADNNILIENHNIFIKLTSGEIKNVFNIELNSEEFKNLFILKNYKKLQIYLYTDDCNKSIINIKFDNDRFIYIYGGKGAYSIRAKEENIFDIIIENNSECVPLNIIPRNVSGDDFECINLNIFTKKSSMFDFQLFYKNKPILSEKIKLRVPISDCYDDKNIIYERFWISEFMINNNLNNCNIKEFCDNSLEDKKYKIEKYFENT